MARFGEIKHKKWYKMAPREFGMTKLRRISSEVWVRRRAGGEMGEGGPAKPYVARVCIGAAGKSGRKMPRSAARCSAFLDGRGKTPTQAIRNAIRGLARSFK